MSNEQQSPAATRPSAVVQDIKALSPHDRALYEAGKQLLVESVATGREFCKFMVGASVSAIPVYLALLKLVAPEDYRPEPWQAGFALFPAALFLGAAILFAIGFFPQRGNLSLDLPDEIERERAATIRHRQLWALVGFIAYAIATASAVGVAWSASTVAAH